MISRRLFFAAAALSTVVSLGHAQTRLFPLSEVRAGMKGKGRTIFSGVKIEDFDVEVLGVLENMGPRQSLILAKLSGGPLVHSGVLQGMSGSPVYIDGRLIGAVAMAFPFSKDPIAGIRPIEEMLRHDAPARRASNAAQWKGDADLLAGAIPPRGEFMSGGSRMVEIATPLSLSGFTAATVEYFAPKLRALGLEPMQGGLGGRRPGSGSGGPLEPGAMISVQLVTGDLNAGADGTVTHVDGTRIHAFGHRFLSVGATDLPFARAEVLTLLPNLAVSFKISAAGERLGAITADHSTAVSGELGRKAKTVPVSLLVKGRRGRQAAAENRYRMEIARDRFLTPFLLQMTSFSAIDATERAVGAATVSTRGKLSFADGSSVPVNNVVTGDLGVGLGASLVAAVPLSYALQSGFAGLDPSEIALEMEVDDEKRQATVDQVWTSRSSVRPGEKVEVFVSLTSQGGQETTRKSEYRVPEGAQPGTLLFTVSDAQSANIADFQALLAQPPVSAGQVTSFLSSMKPNDRAVLRVWRQEAGMTVRGQAMPDPPASIALLLRKTPGVSSPNLTGGTKVSEAEFVMPGVMVAGSRTAQVEIKD